MNCIWARGKYVHLILRYSRMKTSYPTPSRKIIINVVIVLTPRNFVRDSREIWGRVCARTQRIILSRAGGKKKDFRRTWKIHTTAVPLRYCTEWFFLFSSGARLYIFGNIGIQFSLYSFSLRKLLAYSVRFYNLRLYTYPSLTIYIYTKKKNLTFVNTITYYYWRIKNKIV